MLVNADVFDFSCFCLSLLPVNRLSMLVNIKVFTF